MDEAHERLLKVEAAELRAYLRPGGAAELIRATAAHSRALRELFLASLESRTEPVSCEVYTADGPAYRLLRSRALECGELDVVAAVDRLEAFDADEDDVRLVADRLRACGRQDVAADLLRRVEG
jgi:hypothetical protein